MRIAFMGAGLMGAPMIARLKAAGLEIISWNRTATKLARLGVSIASTPAAAASGADAACLCVTDARAIEEIVFGKAGLLRASDRPSLIIDFSTCSPQATRAFAVRAAEAGVDWVDAPVSGGVPGAEAGTLIAFVGGHADAIARAEPILAHVTQRWTHLGEAGSGQAAKMCNQLIASTLVIALAESVILARKLGIDAARLPDAFQGGFADCAPVRIFGARMADEVGDPKLCEIATMRKDAETILAEAGDELSLLSAAAAIYARADALDLNDGDLALLPRLVRG